MGKSTDKLGVVESLRLRTMEGGRSSFFPDHRKFKYCHGKAQCAYHVSNY